MGNHFYLQSSIVETIKNYSSLFNVIFLFGDCIEIIKDIMYVLFRRVIKKYVVWTCHLPQNSFGVERINSITNPVLHANFLFEMIFQMLEGIDTDNNLRSPASFTKNIYVYCEKYIFKFITKLRMYFQDYKRLLIFSKVNEFGL